MGGLGPLQSLKLRVQPFVWADLLARIKSWHHQSFTEHRSQDLHIITVNQTEVTDKYNLILKPHWLSSTIYTLHHYHTVPQALLLMCVMVFIHGRIFGSFTPILCACVCTGDNTGPCRQRHGGKPPTSDGLCGFVCAECAFYISSTRVYEKWTCGVYLRRASLQSGSSKRVYGWTVDKLAELDM